MVIISVIVVLTIYLILNCIIAVFFEKIATLKGYGKDVHAFAMCLCFGIIGCIYVSALPNKIQQEQNQKIIGLMSRIEKKNNTDKIQYTWKKDK